MDFPELSLKKQADSIFDAAKSQFGGILLLIGVAALVLVRPSKTPWHLVNAYEVR